MISEEEWLRTEDGGENYLINQDNENFLPGQPLKRERDTRELKSYNSKDSLMGREEAFRFLEETGVI